MKKRRIYYRIASCMMAFLLVFTSTDMSSLAAEINTEETAALPGETDENMPGGETGGTDSADDASDNDAEDIVDDEAGSGSGQDEPGAAADDREQDVPDAADAGEKDDEPSEDMEISFDGEPAEAAEGDVPCEPGYLHYEGDDQVAIVGRGVKGAGNQLYAVSSLPAQYKTPRLPGLKDQNPYGSCWAFTSMGLAEISRMASGTLEEDYSELALCYFSYNTAEDPLGGTAGDWNKCIGANFMERGGNLNFAGTVMSGWVGATDEARAPYSSVERTLANGLSKSIAYDDKAHLVGHYKADIKKDRDSVKQLIYDYGAVGVSIYAYGSASNEAYNPTYNSYYVKAANGSNHAVTIVGWDDNFSRYHFNKTPAGNGAWLVRNSWWSKGLKQESYYGYFWMSYYDAGLAADAHAFVFDSADNYQHNYQYDGSMQSSYSSYMNTIEGASVFTAKACEYGEQVKAASFVTMSSNVNYTVRVYTDLTDETDPTSGALWDTVTGTTTYEGYYTVPFSRPADVEPGHKFSVVVTLEKPGDFVSLACDYTIYGGWYETKAVASPGQSLIRYGTAGSWQNYDSQNSRNLRIKAFTDDMDPSAPGTPTIRISGTNDIKYGESVGFKALVFHQSPGAGSSVVWSSSDSAIASVDANGVLTAHEVGEITLTATTGELTDSMQVVCGLQNPPYFHYYIDAEDSVELSWDPVPGAQYYIVMKPDGTESEELYFSGTGTCTYQDDSLKDNDDITLAVYRVSAYRDYNSYLASSSSELEIYMGSQNRITYIIGAGRNHPGNPISYTYSDWYELYDATPPKGYSFGGWYTDEAYTNRITKIIGTQMSGNLTLYAKYIPNRYWLRYNANYGGNSRTMYTNYVHYDDELTIYSASTLYWEKEGYTFEKWNTREDGSGTDYFEGQKATKLTDEADAYFDLYAQWLYQGYVITFDADGGSVSPESKRVRTGECFGELPIPEREGMEFEGWYLSTRYLDEEKVEEDTVSHLEADSTLYAKYRDIVGEVIFRADTTADGKVVPGTKVYLSTKLPGTQIYYTLDGSVPDIASAQGASRDDLPTKYYDEAIILTEELAGAGRTVTLKAAAVKRGCADGAVTTMTYELRDESTVWGDIPDDIAAAEGFASAADVPSGLWMAGVKASVPYTGAACTFDELQVYHGKTRLQLKKEYTVKYTNNKNAGTAKITVSGKGNFTGKAEKTFEISKLDLRSAAAEDVVLKYNGKAQKAKPAVLYRINGKYVTLKAGKDYTFEDAGDTEIGQYPLILQGKGNYEGQCEIRKIITNSTPVSKLSFSIKNNNYNGGAPVEPMSITVKNGKTELRICKIDKADRSPDYVDAKGKEGFDCVYYTENNEQPGTASITFVGTNQAGEDEAGYEGAVTKSYKVVGATASTKIKDCSIKLTDADKAVYTGKEITPGVTVTAKDGKQLEAGKDYRVSYTANTNAGKAKVTVTGTGTYSGSKTLVYTIAPCRMDGNDEIVIEDITETPYTKKYISPRVVVKRKIAEDAYEELIAGKDYKTICKNVKGVNSIAVAEITGIGNYAGTVTKSVEIVPGRLSDMSATVKDLVYQRKPGLYKKAAVTLADLNGEKLKKGTDYTIVGFRYANDTPGVEVKRGTSIVTDATRGKRGAFIKDDEILPVGTEIKAVLEYKGSNYEGRTEAFFRIVQRDIAKAKVTVAQQVYEPGKKAEPMKADMVVRFGKEDPLPKSEYEIVSYRNNAAKGNGEVVLRGINNYGGTKTVKFKIAAKSFTILGIKVSR